MQAVTASIEVQIFRRKYSNLVCEPPRAESRGIRLDNL